MSTRRELILQWLCTTLEPECPQAVFRSRALNRHADNGKSFVVIKPARTEFVERSAGVLECSLTVEIEVHGRGQIPHTGNDFVGVSADQAIDELVNNIHAAIVADTTAGGLCSHISPVDFDPTFTDADLPAVVEVLAYRILYFTAFADLSTAIG